MHKTRNFFLLLSCLSGFSLLGQTPDSAPYYPTSQMPDAGSYLPAPPDTSSLLFIDDFQQWLWGKSVRGSARGYQASMESDYSVERMCKIYGSVLGFTVSRDSTPAIFRLLSRGETTCAQAVNRAKAKYMRMRPFARMNEHVGSAFDDESSLRRNGSYPSGHTSLGWTTALMMAQMAPELQDTLLRRGWEYGESRVIVGAHWQSDVDAARLAASACVARLQASPEYRADLAAARTEYRLRHGTSSAAAGYPDGRRILPPPIDTACFRYQGDVAAHWLARSLRNGERGKLAVRDASKNVSCFLNQYAACLAMPLDTASAPRITAFLQYVHQVLSAESRRMKNSSFRRRPFAQLAEPSLLPDEEPEEASDSSFPSTHSALGWGLAMAMVELTPDSMDAILQRGYDYGYSRVVAGYHWASDVQAARVLAACVFVRLHSDPTYQQLAEAARYEYEGLRNHAKPHPQAGHARLKRVGKTIALSFGRCPEKGVLYLYAADGRPLRRLAVDGDTRIALSGLPRGGIVASFAGSHSYCTLETRH